MIVASARIIASARCPSTSGSSSAIDTVLEPEADDAHHLREGGREFFLPPAVDPQLKGIEDARFARASGSARMNGKPKRSR